MVNKGFETTEVIIGVVEAGGKARGEFIYNGPIEDIQDVTKGCGSCTTLYEKKEENGVTRIPFSYKDDNVSNLGSKTKYPGGVINVNKSITVWFNDGEPLDVPNENGPGVIRNYKTKEHLSLFFRVDVKI